jgi:arylsulfatase A-like enzyme
VERGVTFGPSSNCDVLDRVQQRMVRVWVGGLGFMMWFAFALSCTPTDNGSPPPDDDGPPTEDTDTADPDLPLIEFPAGVPTNVLIISVDTARRDYFGRYAALIAGEGAVLPPSNTPNLDAFLAEAVTLDAHRSCSNWTGPSMSCVVSGRTAAAAGFWPKSQQEAAIDERPPADWETIASRFAAEGFRTTLHTGNAFFGPLTGLDHGFDEATVHNSAPDLQIATFALDTAADLLASGDPWLLHVHFMDPHGPYCPPTELLETGDLPPFDGGDMCEEFEEMRMVYWEMDDAWQQAYAAWTTEYYRAEVAAWDAAFGELVDGLDALGALDDTLVMFTTDHGEQLGDRSAFGHGILLGPEETGAAAAFWAKDLAPVAWTETTYHPDLAATLFALHGFAPAVPFEGAVLGTAPSDRAIAIWNLGSGLKFEDEFAAEWGGEADMYISIVRGDVQLDYDWLGRRALYHLDTDPLARVDVYDPTDPDVLDLWPILTDTIADVASYFPLLPDPVATEP